MTVRLLHSHVAIRLIPVSRRYGCVCTWVGIRGAAGVVGYTWGKHVDTNSGTFDRQIRGQKCHESRALHVYAIVCSENVIWMKGKH